jgi:Mn2+/Fe2+ NRAMP family transporter
LKKFAEIALGIMAGLGGFVDIGELVFTSQAGAKFGYRTLWALVLGTFGIIIYSEMVGRIAAVTRRAPFVVIRDGLGPRLGMVVFVASMLLNVATCGAEIGGLALLLQLLVRVTSPLLVAAVVLTLVALVWFTPFEWIERLFGLTGLGIVVFVVAALAHGVDWGAAARGLVPSVPSGGTREVLVYGYFVVGLVSAVMMPYEVYFYGSGAIEDRWKPSDLGINKAVAAIGMSLGCIAAMGITVSGSQIFGAHGIVPELIGTPAIGVSAVLGKAGLVVALVGMIAAIAGAAVETALAGGYNYAQFAGKKWGRAKPARETPAFDAAWIAVLVLGALVVGFGVDPIQLTEGSVMLAVVVLPLTYWPILRCAQDAKIMGKYANSKADDVMGYAVLALVVVVALAAVPFLLLTGSGKY